jgi:hypothetical protein
VEWAEAPTSVVQSLDRAERLLGVLELVLRHRDRRRRSATVSGVSGKPASSDGELQALMMRICTFNVQSRAIDGGIYRMMSSLSSRQLTSNESLGREAKICNIRDRVRAI